LPLLLELPPFWLPRPFVPLPSLPCPWLLHPSAAPVPLPQFLGFFFCRQRACFCLRPFALFVFRPLAFAP
jgi:hypothetical protein